MAALMRIASLLLGREVTFPLRMKRKWPISARVFMGRRWTTETLLANWCVSLLISARAELNFLSAIEKHPDRSGHFPPGSTDESAYPGQAQSLHHQGSTQLARASRAGTATGWGSRAGSYHPAASPREIGRVYSVRHRCSLTARPS